VEVSLDPTGRFLRVRLSGDQTLESLLAALASMEEHPDFRPELNRLWDLSAATMASLSRADFQRIAELTTARGVEPPGARVAVLVAHDVDFGLMRMLDLLTENRRPDELRTFRDRAEAERWLGGGD